MKFVVILFSALFCSTKYIISDGLDYTNLYSDWFDVAENANIAFCQKNLDQKCIGTEKSLSPIHWEKIYNLNYFSRVDIFIEYQASGVWNDQFLDIYANGVLIFQQLITLIDINRPCYFEYLFIRFSFLHESYIYIVVFQVSNQLKLEFKTSKLNQGLYIQNVVINTRTQDGRNIIIPFINDIPTCRTGSGLEFVQYYCKCPSNYVYQVDTCQPSCQANYLYDPSTNECYKKQNCDQCIGLNTVLQCNIGFYKLIGNGASNSDCLVRCPGDYYSDPITMTCLNMENYLEANENNGYPVDHHFFYKETADFFHFFSYNEIFIAVNSMPRKAEERSFIYHNDKFVAGSYSTFKSQTLVLTIKINFPQYRLRFIAIGHFIDFLPKKLDIYINGVLQNNGVFIQSTDNEQKLDQDYLLYFDYNWTRSQSNPIAYNQIIFQIEQPLINDGYQGYWYLDDINIYTFRCKTECTSCYTIQFCSPCTNPLNKNPDCSCMDGYFLQGDLCLACTPICSLCSELGKCLGCKTSTHRINPPYCDLCSDSYFLSQGQDECQPCINGCKTCIANDSCQNCLTEFYKNANGQCVADCGIGFFNDNSQINNPVCSKCSDNCLTCQGLATKCTQCTSESTLIDNHCYSCLVGQYLSGTACLSCIANCSICQTQTCLKCSETYYYQSNINQCVKQCNQNQFGNVSTLTCELCDSSCLSCNNNTPYDCLSCPIGKFLNIINIDSGKCEPNCLVGYYMKEYYCQKCWKGCSSCIDSTQECITCAKNYYRFQQNNFCYELCPDGYYNNVQVCSKCDQNCKTCSNSSELNCLTCFPPLSLFNNQCFLNCPDGYASSNGFCQSCPPYCQLCFGIESNQCSKCMDEFFFLKNQCYFQCPISYIPERPSNICKCKYDNCIECNLQQFYYNNECLDQCPVGTFSVNGVCYACDETCQTCFGGEINECQTCASPLKLFNNECVIECEGSFFHDVLNNICLPCNETCQGCIGPNINDCNACYKQQVLTTRGTCMDTCFDDEYLIISERICNQCDPECLTCFSDSNQSCLTCRNYFYLFSCIDQCPGNATLNSCEQTQINVITDCSYQCAKCEFNSRYCKQCSGNRISNPPVCDCEQGYFDNGFDANCQLCSNQCFTCTKYQDNCILCKGDRLLPKCNCPKYYYDDGISTNCIKCEDNCETCSSSGCITCLTNRINPPDCSCPNGYYEVYELFCLKCAPQCSTCFESKQLCQTCSELRENPPICSCQKGYFEDEYLQCRKCHDTCLECDIMGCISCFGNRIGPIDGLCICQTPGISRLSVGSQFCTDCTLGVPYFELKDDFTGFTIDFGGQISLPDSDFIDICQLILEQETLQLLGTNPICNDKSVQFGELSSIKIGDIVKLEKQFQLIGCDQKFQDILTNPLSLSKTIDLNKHKPLIKFKKLNYPNVCSPISIEFAEKSFNGNQQLNVIWKKIHPMEFNQNIESILLATTQNNNEILVFPPQTLSPKTLYKFEVSVQNFVGLENTFAIEFMTALYPNIVVTEIGKVYEFLRFQEISLVFTIQYYYCSQIYPQNQMVQYEITLKNNNLLLQNGTITEGLTDGKYFNNSSLIISLSQINIRLFLPPILLLSITKYMALRNSIFLFFHRFHLSKLKVEIKQYHPMIVFI